MIRADARHETRSRGPLRPRFRFALLGAALLGLAACSDHFGFGFAELPADSGWLPLPIGAWVVNEGIAPRTLAFCPRESCTQPGFAALLTVEGERGHAMERALAAGPAALARAFSQPPADRQGKPRRPSAKSSTTATRFDEAGTNGVLVEIAGRETGKRAYAALLYGRSGVDLTLAFAVAAQADEAKATAASVWRSR